MSYKKIFLKSVEKNRNLQKMQASVSSIQQNLFFQINSSIKRKLFGLFGCFGTFCFCNDRLFFGSILTESLILLQCTESLHLSLIHICAVAIAAIVSDTTLPP